MPLRSSRATSSPWPGTRVSTRSKYVVGGAGMNARPSARNASTVACTSWQPQAICWMPSPLYACRYSSIWLCASALSLIGMRMRPSGLVSARECSPVYSPLIAKKRISRKLNSFS